MRPARSNSRRRKQLQYGGILAGCALLVIFLFTRVSFFADRAQAGTPKVVIVTVLDHDSMSQEYIRRIEENRRDYAARQGTPKGNLDWRIRLTFFDRLRYLLPKQQ